MKYALKPNDLRYWSQRMLVERTDFVSLSAKDANFVSKLLLESAEEIDRLRKLEETPCPPFVEGTD